jgi:hypothetical protein
MLKAKPGIVYAEALSQRDGDAYSYMIESEVGVDIRKSLFFTLAEKKWPLVGMEALGMSLEDIFINIVDQTSQKSRYERRDTRSRRAQQHSKTSIEAEIAQSMLKKNAAEKSELSDVFDDDK